MTVLESSELHRSYATREIGDRRPHHVPHACEYREEQPAKQCRANCAPAESTTDIRWRLGVQTRLVQRQDLSGRAHGSSGTSAIDSDHPSEPPSTGCEPRRLFDEIGSHLTAELGRADCDVKCPHDGREKAHEFNALAAVYGKPAAALPNLPRLYPTGAAERDDVWRWVNVAGAFEQPNTPPRIGSRMGNVHWWRSSTLWSFASGVRGDRSR